MSPLVPLSTGPPQASQLNTVPPRPPHAPGSALPLELIGKATSGGSERVVIRHDALAPMPLGSHARARERIKGVEASGSANSLA